MRAIDLSQDPLSPIALKYQMKLKEKKWNLDGKAIFLHLISLQRSTLQPMLPGNYRKSPSLPLQLSLCQNPSQQLPARRFTGNSS